MYSNCQRQSYSRESPTVVRVFVSCHLGYFKYMLHRKYGIRHDNIAWCTNKIMVVYCVSVCSVRPQSSCFLLHREGIAQYYKKPSLDRLSVQARIFFFFSQNNCRNLMQTGSTDSLHSIIKYLERSFAEFQLVRKPLDFIETTLLAVYILDQFNPVLNLTHFSSRSTFSSAPYVMLIRQINKVKLTPFSLLTCQLI